MRALPTAVRAAAAAAFLLAAALPGQEPDSADRKPALVVIRLPAGATLEIEGYKSKQEGEVRVFETPPLTPGNVYAYLLKATWTDGDREVTREARAVLRAGETTEVDLRREQPAAFKVVPPAGLDLRQGETKPLTVKIERDTFKGPVALTFAGVPDGVKLLETTIPADQGEAAINVRVDAGAVPGTASVILVARGGPVEQKAAFRLTVQGPASPAVEPPKTVPVPTEIVRPPAPPKGSFAIGLPEGVTLVPGGPRRLLPVTVTRGSLQGPVRLHFASVPAGVVLSDAVVGEGKVKAYVAAEAGADAAEMEIEIKAVATCEDARAEAVLKVKVSR